MKNKKVGFVIQGITFLKSVMPLVLIASKIEGIEPVLILFESRPGKPNDNLDLNYISSIYQVTGIQPPECHIVSDQRPISSLCLRVGLDALVGQDIQYHLDVVLSDERISKVKTFSICNFFDSLHHAYDVSNTQRKFISPDGMFFPDKRFEKSHEALLEKKDRSYKTFSVGNPFYDHPLFNSLLPNGSPLIPPKNKRSIAFFTTLQSLVSKESQDSLESFLLRCIDTDISVIIKSKVKTPWTFKSKKLNEINQINGETGIPGCSLSLILNTDAHISSYSTSAVEAEHFGKPVINLPSVSKEKLTDSVRRIKFEYGIDTPFVSKTAITSDKGLYDLFEELTSTRNNPSENITWDTNNSVRILTEIKNFL